MTSTNINIGIEGRSCTRVVKPPGGGHTDIFGSPHEKMEVVGSSRYGSKQSQKSSISECFGYGHAPPAVRKQDPIIKENNETAKIVANNENGFKNGNGNTPTEDENTKPTVVTVAATVPPVAQRVRVPPGGFSSGLW